MLGFRAFKNYIGFYGDDSWVAATDRYIYIILEYTKTTDQRDI